VDHFFQELNNSVDIYLLQEHWLFDCQLNLLNEIHQQYTVTGLYIPGIHFDCWENLYKEDSQRWLIYLGLLWSLCIVYDCCLLSVVLLLYNTTTRQQYVVEFMAENQMYMKEIGPTFINAKGKDCTSIHYILFQES
jgi:hypothetical protein